MRLSPRIAFPAAFVLSVLSFSLSPALGQAPVPAPTAVPARWSADEAWQWYHPQPWLVGCNFLPSTAVNDTEMWQRETFDPTTIDRELGLAESLGFNSCRIFLQYVVWKDDPQGFKSRFDRFLSLAKSHGLTVMPILFDDCAFAGKEPYLGKQDDPIPGVHNSGWVPSPGHKLVADRQAWGDLKRYVQDMVGRFGQDQRVLLWDLYNEPSLCDKNGQCLSLPLVEAAFRWAREAKPSQPLTTSIFGPPPLARRITELSDVINLHHYGDLASLKAEVAARKSLGRPILCTEWMARGAGSRFETHLPYFQQERIACYNWGLVAGRTQTYYPWGSPKGAPEPKPWHHDIFRRDGTPYDAAEIATIHRYTRAAPEVFTSDGTFLAEVRARVAAGDPALAPAVKKLRQQADKSLKAGPFAVTDKTTPAPSGDPHDYVSMAPYWWPNPNTPDGLPYVRRDGVSNPERKKFDSDRLYAMSGNVYTLSLAYYLTGHEPYAEHAARLLRVWFLDPPTRMKPNLDYGQFVRGQTEGRAEGLIETTSLRSVVDAAGLLAGSPAWTAGDQQGLEAWFRQFLAWMRQSKIGRAEAAAKNNHGTWYDVQVATFHLFLGDEAAARQVVEDAKSKRIARQIEPDGKQPRELARTKAFGYSQFNLAGLFELASLGERVGVDLWNYRTEDGRGIRPALDWLAPYATGRQAWPYQQIQKTKLDGMATLLRRAAVAYHDAKYETMIGQLKLSGRESDRANLLYPPCQTRP